MADGNMKTLHHVDDGEQDFHPVDVGTALRFPEWKRTPWTKAETDAYRKGEADYLAAKPSVSKPGDPLKSKQALAKEDDAHAKACAALKAAVAKAAPRPSDGAEALTS
jgi:hypothetical protein